MKSSKKIVNIRFDEEKWEKIKKIAEEQGMSASAFVRKCVYDAISKKTSSSFPPQK